MPQVISSKRHERAAKMHDERVTFLASLGANDTEIECQNTNVLRKQLEQTKAQESAVTYHQRPGDRFWESKLRVP